jgi:pimeloyl-ACP methyl ester carboxylesterase
MVTEQERAADEHRLVQGRFGRAHCLDSGCRSAPVAVLLHGLGSRVEEIYAGLGPTLRAAGFRVVAIDRPGYGASDPLPAPAMCPAGQAQWLADVLTALGIREVAVVVGHSYGAAVALRLAARLRRPPRGVVLVNPFCRPTRPAAVPLMRMSVAPLVGAIMRRRVIPAISGPLVRSALARACAPDAVPSTLDEAVVAALGQVSAVLSMAAELSGYNSDVGGLPATRGNLACPIVILSGAGDQVIEGRGHAEWLASFLPRAEHRCVPGGHMLHHVRPDLVRDAMRDVMALAA